MRAKIAKKDGEYKLELSASAGEIKAIRNALALYAEQSFVAYDISIALQKAMQQEFEPKQEV